MIISSSPICLSSLFFSISQLFLNFNGDLTFYSKYARITSLLHCHRVEWGREHPQMFRRSPYFSLAYAANDVVLIVLWTLASLCDKRYIAVIVCFAMFLVNDIYGFISWQRMKVKQGEEE